MKRINEFITERFDNLYYTYRNNKTTLFFENMITATLFKMELAGQISDGLYENSSPQSHWVWVSNCDCKLNKNKVGYEGPMHRKRYTLSSLIKHIGKNENGWLWTSRILWYAKFASVLKDSDFDVLMKEAEDIRYVIEQIGEAVENDDYKGYDDFYNRYVGEYGQKKIDKSKLLTKENIEACINSKYDLNDLKKDNKSLSETVNVELR